MPNETVDIYDYMDCIDKLSKWCLRRAQKGDVTVEQLAKKISDNVIIFAERKGVQNA